MERYLIGQTSPTKIPKQSRPIRTAKPDETKDELLYDLQGPYVLRKNKTGWYRDRPFDFAVVNAPSFAKTASKAGGVHVTTLAEI
ncbi:hypothetical protein SUNI508_14081, partial [Seiridium unicorne]